MKPEMEFNQMKLSSKTKRNLFTLLLIANEMKQNFLSVVVGVNRPITKYEQTSVKSKIYSILELYYEDKTRKGCIGDAEIHAQKLTETSPISTIYKVLEVLEDFAAADINQFFVFCYIQVLFVAFCSLNFLFGTFLNFNFK